MSTYFGKIIELTGIETQNEKSYLHIKLSFGEDVELFWEIDHDTAESLKAVAEFDGIHKNRLSLHTTLDSNEQQFYSTLTKTYLDKSNRISFTCSKEYNNNLESIKSVQSIQDLMMLPDLYTELTYIHEPEENQKPGQSKDKDLNNEVIHSTDEIKNEIDEISYLISKKAVHHNYKNWFKWGSISLISVVLALFIGYVSLLFNKSNIEQKTLTNTNIEIAEASVVTDKNTSPPKKREKQPTNHPNVPYIELTDSISFSIPEGYVAITFDDGPSAYTKEIIDTLKKYNAGGTFFFIGNNVKKHPEMVQYVQSNGYSIGSHSMSHLEMSNLNFEKQKFEINQSSKEIENISNIKVDIFRPPYGAFNTETKTILNENDQKMVLWNNDPKDWKFRNADKIYHHIVNTKTSGSIIILHETQATTDILPNILEHLQKQGLNIVSLKSKQD